MDGGQKAEGTRNGLGLYYWNDGTAYWGHWVGGQRNGMGIYICPEGHTLNNCTNGYIYVGEWKDSQKQGKGTVYDKSGKLIYYGDFQDGKPIGTYPSEGSYSLYSFQTIKYNNGNMYVGEMMGDKRSGKGLYIWTETNSSSIVWYGSWKDDVREGYGISIYGNGNECSTGSWKNDTKQ